MYDYIDKERTDTAVLLISDNKEQDIHRVQGQGVPFLLGITHSPHCHQEGHLRQGQGEGTQSQLRHQDQYRRAGQSASQDGSQNEDALAE